MPNDRQKPETDGDPNTALEDTSYHGRTGFLLTGEDFNPDMRESESEERPYARANKNRP